MYYLEHETEVKFYDGFLEKSQDWQWFIDEIEQNYKIDITNSWENFINKSYSARDVLSYFVKILQVCDKEWNFKNAIFKEIWEISKYFLGSITLNECKKQLNIKDSKIFLLCVWITKLINSDNGYDFLFNIGILREKNYFQIAKINSIIACEKEILEYIQELGLGDIEKAVNCLCDNINGIEHSYSENYFKELETVFMSYTAFSFNSKKAELYSTWQERYLLDMLRIQIDGKKIIPEITFKNGTTIPDIELWSVDIINCMKTFFNNKTANFILDTVLYIKHNITPCDDTILEHINLLLNEINKGTSFTMILRSSSCKVFSLLFKERLTTNISSHPTYIALMKAFQACSEPMLIENMQTLSLPISKSQNVSLKNYYANRYKEIDNVNKREEFLSYIEDESVTKLIDTIYFEKVKEKFNNYVTEFNDILVSTIFYEYMLFLLKVNSNSHNVDKRIVSSEMIRVQKLWQEVYFKKQSEHLSVFKQEISIPTEEIDEFNIQLLNNPLLLSQYIISCDEEEILKSMEIVSENVLINMVTKMSLTPIYPIKETIDVDSHEIDKTFLEIINNIIETKRYKFLNILDDVEYLNAIHEAISRKANMLISFFYKTDELYNLVKSNIKIELIPYEDKITLATLTQFFPILEQKIREMSMLLNIFPFKKTVDSFMLANDPSSLLRELILLVYEQQKSFKNIPDLLFVYNMMYNGNSCNIRNECMHGRKYLSGNELKFALKITMFALYMVIYRINLIKENTSKE